MTWRLKAIALYQRDGPGRQLHEFKTHGLNIISGDSKTGKSAVIDIINYGLMSDSCPVPKGIIRRAVATIGLHLEGPRGEMLVLRDLPGPGRKSTGTSWVKEGRDLAFPDECPPLDRNADFTKDRLSTFTGISGANLLTNYTEPGGDYQSGATIRHAAPLCFQPQDVIANRHVAFPGLDREYHRRHLLDAVPFLLGIETAETLAKRSELRELKTRLRRIQLQGLEQQRLRASAFDRGYALYLRCVGKGILAGAPPTDVAGLLTALRGVTLETTNALSVAGQVPDLKGLEDAEARTREAVAGHRRRIRELKRFEEATTLHQGTVERQLARISVAELLPSPKGETRCPVCEDGTLHEGGAGNGLQDLRSRLETVKAVPLQIDFKSRTARHRLESELPGLEEANDAARARVREAVTSLAANAAMLSAAREVDLLVGQVQEYVQNMSVVPTEATESTEDLENRVKGLQQEIEGSRVRREKAQAAIADAMTLLARQMEVEFANGNTVLDLEDLTIKVQVDPDEPMTPLSEVGSGANWVSYHVAAVLALHQHLADKGCPVPRLIVLDQPSQAWFPKVGEHDPKLRSQEDVARVLGIFRLVQEVASKKGYSQVIVLDHAHFDDPGFKAALLPEWRNGRKLVPDHWDPRPGQSE